MSVLVGQIADFLENEDVGTREVDIHPGFMASEPDDAVAILDTGGYPPHEEVKLTHPTFQILNRGVFYPDVMNKAWKIYELLNRENHLELVGGGIVLRWCFAEAPPLFLGLDGNNRVQVSTNYRTSIIETELIPND